MDAENNSNGKNSDAGSSLSLQPKEVERGTWGSKVDFLLSTIGFAVGLGNVWRFPYLAYRNGGGAFLIPYVIMLTFTGIPLFFMELAFGQFGSEGPITIWKVAPLFKGIGWSMAIISGLVSIYYNVIIAWTIFYFFASLTSKLPWMDCNNEWNSPSCKEWNKPYCNESLNIITNCTNTSMKTETPSEQYWKYNVLGISDGVENMGIVQWKLVLCLLGAWVVVFLALSKGIKSSGKVVYFTAVFPYVVLIILLGRNAALPGAVDGVLFYVTPDFSRLSDSQVWMDAATQIFYSLGVGFGGLEVMASYNKFKNNCYRDAILVAVINCSTSIFAGFVIFSAIGFMSHTMGVPIEKVADSGPGLAFVVYPEGIAQMPISPLWSCLFFLMLFTLGLDSQFTFIETIISAFSDEFLILRRYKTLFTGCVCFVLFLLGIPCCMNGGMYIFNLIDSYCAGFSLLITALFEVIVIVWVYGFNRFSDDIHMMLGMRPNLYWRITWQILTPGFILFILIFSMATAKPLSYNDYIYPCWAQIMGIAMVLVSSIFIPLMMGVETCRFYGCAKTMKAMTTPLPEWGPANLENRTGIYALPPYKQQEYDDDIKPAHADDIYMVSRKGQINDGYNSDSDTTHIGPISDLTVTDEPVSKF